MIPFFYIENIRFIAAVWAAHTLAYFGLLKKMGIDGRWALIPVAAEGKMARIHFLSLRVFLQSVLTACLFLGASFYVGEDSMFSVIFWMAGGFLYGIFLLRLIWRICKSFGKSLPFRIFAMFFPYLCLLILGYGRATFQGAPDFPIRRAPLPIRILLLILSLILSLTPLLSLPLSSAFQSPAPRPQPRFRNILPERLPPA